MSDQARTLPPGSVKDRQISGQAKIGHSKLAPVTEAQVLVGGSNKKLSAQTVSGDATLANDGTLTLDSTKLEAKVKAVLTELDIESGSQKNITASEIKNIYEEIDGVNQFTTQYSRDLKDAGDANTGSTLVKRDGSGNIAVGTVTGDLAGTATNADKLDNKASDFYTNADNTTAGTSTTATVGTLITVTQNHPSAKVVATVSGTDGSGPNPASSATIPHNLGFIPSVSVVTVDGSTITPIETEVVNGVNSTTITLTQTIGSLVGNPDLEVRLG